MKPDVKVILQWWQGPKTHERLEDRAILGNFRDPFGSHKPEHVVRISLIAKIQSAGRTRNKARSGQGSLGAARGNLRGTRKSVLDLGNFTKMTNWSWSDESHDSSELVSEEESVPRCVGGVELKTTSPFFQKRGDKLSLPQILNLSKPTAL